MAKWALIGDVKQMTRMEILDANEWLDALEEAEDEAQQKADMRAQEKTGLAGKR